MANSTQINGIEWVHSDGMSKQERLFNTVYFSDTIVGCSSRKCYQNLLTSYATAKRNKEFDYWIFSAGKFSKNKALCGMRNY